MKVDGPSSTRATSASKKASKAKKSGGAGFASALNDTGSEEQSASSLSGAAPASGLDALLALQQVDDATAGEGGQGNNAQGQAWGEELLERLEDIRTGLLLGVIPQHRLQQLADSVSKKQGDVTDPRLSDILSEIEVRARVELAKYQR
ncbi:flagellar assembly protein FliX [Aestuariispira insulae]|uniref:Class II flagellar assembly regulator n=1 Tax=Aestuariispira insulae TaxID=1461337 RepID=A0A3D9HSI7_9PROT|nr:flagellar assembly protein FliX [Aestuariispira insulae]RED52454.1 class II flagellar assembly regulator [Aestuariispira insulae]